MQIYEQYTTISHIITPRKTFVTFFVFISLNRTHLKTVSRIR